MATKFEKILGNTVLGFITATLAYLLSVGIYTLLYGNSFFYNVGYTIGCSVSWMSSFF